MVPESTVNWIEQFAKKLILEYKFPVVGDSVDALRISFRSTEWDWPLAQRKLDKFIDDEDFSIIDEELNRIVFTKVIPEKNIKINGYLDKFRSEFNITFNV